MYSALLHLVTVAPALVGADKLSELRAVIAQMVYADHVIAKKAEYFVQRPAYYGSWQVTDMKGLCNVDGRIVYTDCFAVADRWRAVFIAAVQNIGQNRICKRNFIDLEIKIAVDSRSLADNFVADVRIFQLLCNGDGAFS